jgi:glutamyl-tRNA reductase
MNVICLGLSHRTASVEVRERFAIPEVELGDTIGKLSKLPGIAEAVIVSTCNRVELYVATEDAAAGFDSLRTFVTNRVDGAITSPKQFDAFYALDGSHSINHLFRVVCGLDSMVLGETEILGQVKKAYAAATGAGSTSRNLNKLFQRAFNVAKEVRTKTNITRGPVSVGSVAVDLAEKIFGRLATCKVMILGAGETSELTARALLSRGVKSIFVSNRSYDRAAVLAAEMGGEAIHFDEWDRRFHDIDILISSTAAPHAIVTKSKLHPVMHQRPERPLFVIDLAVPRDVEPAVNDLDGVYLYDIDSLQAIAAHGMEIRRREIVLCEQMIERHVNEFTEWLAGPAPSITLKSSTISAVPKKA